MSLLKAVFWDVDGTIADTELRGHRIAFNYAFKQLGLDWFWDESTYTKLLSITGGRKRISTYADTVKLKLTEIQLDSIYSLKQQSYTNILLSGDIQLRNGVLRLTSELKSKGIKQIIVTTSTINSIRSLLNGCFRNNSIPFDNYITYESVNSTKPSPECYLRALSISNALNHECIAIEDSENGVRSARSAGIKCLLIPCIDGISCSQSTCKPAAIINQLGERDSPTHVYAGPTCKQGYITSDYLDQLLII